MLIAVNPKFFSNAQFSNTINYFFDLIFKNTVFELTKKKQQSNTKRIYAAETDMGTSLEEINISLILYSI